MLKLFAHTFSTEYVGVRRERERESVLCMVLVLLLLSRTHSLLTRHMHVVQKEFA